MHKVTVIIPTWNRAPLLLDAVKSALAQTYPPFEILICDDGSTDSSEEAIKSIDDSRVKWVAGERGGRPAIPRNRGIAKSKGNWLAFLDSDDRWYPEKLENQFDALAGTTCQASCTNAFRVKGVGCNSEKLINWEKEIISFNDLASVNRVVCSSVLVSKNIVQEVGGFPEDIELTACEDYALWLKVCARTNFAYCQEALVDYSDLPEESIRQFYTDGESVKKAVCSHFIAWASGDSTLKSYNNILSKTIKKNKIPLLGSAARYLQKIKHIMCRN